MAVPRVVPRASKFNDLKCQTFLTEPIVAKGIFPNCKTERVTRDHVRFTPIADICQAMSALGQKQTYASTPTNGAYYSGARALRSGASEILIRPLNGSFSSKIK